MMTNIVTPPTPDTANGEKPEATNNTNPDTEQGASDQGEAGTTNTTPATDADGVDQTILEQVQAIFAKVADPTKRFKREVKDNLILMIVALFTRIQELEPLQGMVEALRARVVELEAHAEAKDATHAEEIGKLKAQVKAKADALADAKKRIAQLKLLVPDDGTICYNSFGTLSERERQCVDALLRELTGEERIPPWLQRDVLIMTGERLAHSLDQLLEQHGVWRMGVDVREYRYVVSQQGWRRFKNGVMVEDPKALIKIRNDFGHALRKKRFALLKVPYEYQGGKTGGKRKAQRFEIVDLAQAMKDTTATVPDLENLHKLAQENPDQALPNGIRVGELRSK